MASGYRSYAQLLAVLFGLAILLSIPGFAISRKLGGEEAVAGMFWGCGLCLVAAAAGGLPQIASGGSAQQGGTLMLSSLAIRMGLTLFGALAIVLTSEVSRTAFLLWVAVSYMVFLIADVVFVLTRKVEDSR